MYELAKFAHIASCVDRILLSVVALDHWEDLGGREDPAGKDIGDGDRVRESGVAVKWVTVVSLPRTES